jgi:uncharacterized membrane protein YeaQ/YmgE (transglycosylase-associated protein family)
MLWSFIIGLVVGWVANAILCGGGYGLIVNLILGLIGALLGSWIVRLINFEAGLFALTLSALIGSALVIWFATAMAARAKKGGR